MPKKEKHVDVHITFGEKGNVTMVHVNGPNGHDVEGKPGPEPEHPVGVCKLMVLEGDDPCITQGGIRWCW
jgi:hypothetical protein